MKLLYISIYGLAIVQLAMLQILESEMLLYGIGLLLYALEYFCLIIFSFFIFKGISTRKGDALQKISKKILITQSTVLLYNITWSILVCRITDKLEWYYDRLHNDNIYLSPPPLFIIISVGILSAFYILYSGKIMNHN